MTNIGEHLDTALACAAIGAASGWFVPRLIARLPEPEDPPAEDPPAQQTNAQQPNAQRPKEAYAAIGELPRLAVRTALCTAIVTGLLGLAVGWHWGLAYLLYLAPVGVALALVDWRTRLLPTRLIAPSYAVVGILVVAASAVEQDWSGLERAAIGWAATGAFFFALWFIHPKGMGYGDVRLSGVLGMALGHLGWAELVVGVYAAFVVGGVIGLLLSLLKIVDRKSYPFGPFMLVGALIGVMIGPWLGGYLVGGTS